jgi:sugar lactone lactonase YvrE
LDAGRSIADSLSNRPLPGFYRFAGSSGKQLQSVLGIGKGPQQFNNPKGIAISPVLEQQIVYIADSGNNRVMRFQLSTQ